MIWTANPCIYTCSRIMKPRNYNMVPYCVSCVVSWKKKGEKCHVWLWEPLDFSRRYHIVISRFHYSGTCINARISCSNHVLVRRINHSDRWGDQNPTFFSEIFPSLLPRTNRDSIIWQKDKCRVLNSSRSVRVLGLLKYRHRGGPRTPVFS